VRFYFARHGESEANLVREFSNRGWRHGLTPSGFQQARSLAYELKDVPFARIYTSPLKRAVETAQVLAGELDLEVEVTDALREFDTGINEGRRDPESWSRWENVIADWCQRGLHDSRIEQGESLTDMLERFVPFLNGLRARFQDGPQNLLLIGHGGFYFTVLPQILGNITYTDLEYLEFPNTAYVLAEETPRGLVCLEWCGKKFQD
jgi:probable phosphoglycerate mutase